MLGGTTTLLDVLRLFQSGYTTVHFHQQCMSVLLSHVLTNTCYFLVSVCFSNHLSVCEVVSDAVGFDCISLLKTLSMLP